MRTKYFALIITMFLTSGCDNNVPKSENTVKTANNSGEKNPNDIAAEVADSVRHANIKHLKIANQNDPVCDMPVVRDFDDTVTYMGKLIGFCSKDCKEEFVKNPAAYKIKYN